MQPWNGPRGGDSPIRCDATLLVFSPQYVFLLLRTLAWSPNDYSAYICSKQGQEVVDNVSGHSTGTTSCVVEILLQARAALSSGVPWCAASGIRCPSDCCLNALFVVLHLKSYGLERHAHAPCDMLVRITEGSDLRSHTILKTRFCGTLVLQDIISKHTFILSIILVDMWFTFHRLEHKPHNIFLVLVGPGILWSDWNGFNGGDPYTAGTDAGAAVLNTNIATAMSALVWITWDTIYYKKPSVLGGVNDMITGLVAIAPAAGVVAGWGAIILSTSEGDAAFNISNPVRSIDGNGKQIGWQLTGACFVIGWNTVWTSLILLFIKHVLRMPLRMSEVDLLIGDDAIHGEDAYSFDHPEKPIDSGGGKSPLVDTSDSNGRKIKAVNGTRGGSIGRSALDFEAHLRGRTKPTVNAEPYESSRYLKIARRAMLCEIDQPQSTDAITKWFEILCTSDTVERDGEMEPQNRYLWRV
ncbi:hypothetical protein BS47DRAFT_1394981 [Hydnum rufescens UP504]|uniref:Ammonium transporter AmtB-like domain-containing protein n=1 Tax=Hydnum rufescens UP504 TaxID=1448309 RepID=A0A9P6ATC3_9AGAM|nr:hypothetical protein BS47DRAFT_1394981 [Hydnum rufescens UP504]